MNSAIRDLLLLVGGAALLWYLLKEKVGAPGGALDRFIAQPIAYVISSLTLPGTQHVAGGAVLQDGGYVSFDAIVSAGGSVDGNGNFPWNGSRYRLIQSRRSDGNYDAVRV